MNGIGPLTEDWFDWLLRTEFDGQHKFTAEVKACKVREVFRLIRISGCPDAVKKISLLSKVTGIDCAFLLEEYQRTLKPRG